MTIDTSAFFKYTIFTIIFHTFINRIQNKQIFKMSSINHPANDDEDQLPPTQNNIVRLDEDTIHQIAAGEVVQSPSAALKEMLENCLDAGATKIQVVGDDGGLALLQVSDNGHGIAKDDFPLVCTRFATSKLKTIEDLKSLETFGFRGEALAAISYCARVKITSKTKEAADDDLGYTASFLNGKMVEEEPQLCQFGGTIGSHGTIIRVEDLFYNAPLRRKAYGKTQDEWNRVVDVVSKYALQNPKVGFSCTKQGAVKMDVALPPNSTFQGVVSAIKVGGSNVTKHLRTLEDKHLVSENHQQQQENNNNGGNIMMMMGASADAAAAAKNNQQEGANSALESFKFHGYYTDVPYCSMTRKTTLILFVNGRLVDSPAIRRVVDMAYAQYLIGAARGWWVFLSIQAKPDTVDANVHPTKHEVMMLHEASINGAIFQALRKGLQANVTAQNTVTLSSTSQSKLQRSVAVSSSNVTSASNMMMGNSHKTFGTNGPSSALSSSALPAAAPCMVARVNEQRGSMLKFVVPVQQQKKNQQNNENNNNDGENENKNKNDDQLMQQEDSSKKTAEIHIKQEKNDNHIVASTDTTDSDDGVVEIEAPASQNQQQQQPEQEAPKTGIEFFASLFAPKNASSSVLPERREREKDDDDDDEEKNNEVDVLANLLGNDDDDDDDDDDENGMFNFKKFQQEKQQEQEEQEEEKKNNNSDEKSSSSHRLQEQVEEEQEELDSVISIRNSFRRSSHNQYTPLLRKTALVGSIDAQKALIQCDTSLLLLDVPGTVFYLAQQRVFYANCWSKFARWELEQPLDLEDTITSTLTTSPVYRKTIGAVAASVEGVAKKICQTLIQWKDMFDEYFAVSIREEENETNNENKEDGDNENDQKNRNYKITGMPALFGSGLEVHVDLIGTFLIRLATEVNFKDEELCFRGIGKEIAFLFAACAARVRDSETLLRDVVIPALRGSLLPPLTTTTANKNNSSTKDERSKMLFWTPEEMVRKFVVQPLVSTEQLYRVFERC